jgi:hypothetical protein
MLRDIPDFVRVHSQNMNVDYVINFVMRPFCYFTFHLNYIIAGTATTGYRIVNIGIHALMTLSMYAFLKHLLTRGPKEFTWAAGISFCCAALFAVNPMQTEAVTYTVQRFTTLAACLYIISLYGHLRAMDATSKNARVAWQSASLLALILGMLTKEVVFTAPIMMVLLNIVVFRKTLLQSLRNTIPQICCLPIIPLMMIMVERGDQIPGVDLDDVINLVNYSGRHPFDYLMTQTRALLSYFRLLILPHGQSFQHTYPIHTSLFDAEVMISLAIIALFLIAAFRLGRRSNDSLANLISFFILWYFVTISVTSSFIPLDEIFVERRVYLPSVGLIAGLSLHLIRIGQQSRIKIFSTKSLSIVCMILVILYMAIAVGRVKVWSSKLTLWQDVVKTNPRNSTALNDLGYEYLKYDNYEAAIPYLQRALEVYPSLQTYQNLGSAFMNSGKYREARDVYRDGLSHFSDDYLLLTGAGAASCLTGEVNNALYFLQQAIAIYPQGAIAVQYYKMTISKASESKLPVNQHWGKKQ